MIKINKQFNLKKETINYGNKSKINNYKFNKIKIK